MHPGDNNTLIVNLNFSWKKNQFCREVNSPWTRRLLHSVPIALSLFVAISSAAEAMAANVTEVSVSQQVIEFTGTVVDVNGNPLIGVNVVEKGTENAAITDFEGNFSLSYLRMLF